MTEKSSWKGYKKEIDYVKYLEKERLTLLIGFIIMTFFCFFLLSLLFFGYPELDGKEVTNCHVNLSFENMSSTEIYNAKKVLNSIKPEYINMQKSIKFLKGDLYSSNKTRLWGVNYNNGDIILRYTGDRSFDISVLKHECAHTFVDSGDRKLDEWIVQDLEESNFMEV